MIPLDDRVAIVIGSARGIGAAIAARLARDGARLVVGDVAASDPATVARRLGPPDRVVGITVDVAERNDVAAVIDTAVGRFGRLDILVQNAGIYPWTLIEDTEPEEWDRVLAVNLRGTYLAARAALPAMRARGFGRMVFTSSITGPRVTSPGHGHYSASKAGINGFIRSAALEFASAGITVNGVEPGNILTEGVATGRSAAFIEGMRASIPIGRLGTPDDVAHAVRFLVDDASSFITGTTILVDGGQTLPEGKDFSIAPQSNRVAKANHDMPMANEKP